MSNKIKSWIILSSLTLGLAGCASTTNGTSKEAQTNPMIGQRIGNNLPTRSDGKIVIDVAEVARVNLQLATSYYGYGQFDAAQDAISRAIQAEPDNPQILVVAGFIKLAMKDREVADAYFLRAIKSGSGDPEVLTNYGTYLCRTSREAQSIEYFDKALKVKNYKNPATAHNSAGMCLLKIGQYDQAHQRFNEVLEIEPMNATALLGSAEIKYREGKFEQSLENLKRFLKVAPSNARSLWLEVKIHRKLGNKSDEKMASSDLKNNFQESEQTKKLIAGDFNN